MICKKCGNPGSVTIRRKDSYCKDCFLSSVNHKFRACIGKNKILHPNSKVLVGLSGGLGSTLLFYLINHSLSLDSHKRLRINPIFVHITGIKNDFTEEKCAKSLIELCKKFNFDLYIVHITEYIVQNNSAPLANSMPTVIADGKHFYEMLESLSATSKNDFLIKLKQSLFVKYANIFQCNIVFTAETTSTLASNLLSSLALGRGSQIENDVSFCDSRDENVKILRPIKDISKEEMENYANIQQLTVVADSGFETSSLQKVIMNFVTDLQDNFPATISTLCKTGEKISTNYNRKIGRCVICKSNLDNEDKEKLSALDATQFSRLVSHSKPQENGLLFESNNSDVKNESDNLFVNKRLCYGCNINYSQMGHYVSPGVLKNTLL